jgi:Xaa-Pro dipeptidase
MTGLNLQRLEKFQILLKTHGFDCYLACTPISMGYLAGFFEGGGERMLFMAIPQEGEPVMIVPTLSATHAKHTGIKDIRTWNDGEDAGFLFEQLANEWNLRTAVIAVDDEMLASHLLRLQVALPAALFKARGDIMAELRKQKDAKELSLMKKAAEIAEDAFSDFVDALNPGVSEMELQQVILQGMMKRGGIPTFCIVAGGVNGAEPHHNSSSDKIKQGDVIVVDWGCSVDAYLSDITRTVCIGEPSDEAKEVYKIVYDSHMSARKAIKPGVACEDIDKAARSVIEKAGYGEYFVHRTGHGIGMMGHEPPHIVSGSKSPLVIGQCFSIEPGIYLPGKFGVRIENIVTVTKDGHESLNKEPSETLISFDF